VRREKKGEEWERCSKGGGRVKWKTMSTLERNPRKKKAESPRSACRVLPPWKS
jgi:hypothetical protein